MKPGWKTSEFWLSLLGMAMPLVATLQAVPNPWVALPAAGVAAVYAASRAATKKADALAAAHVAANTSPVLGAFGAATPAERAAAAAVGATAIPVQP